MVLGWPKRRYNDPDNVLGPHGTVGQTTEAQASTQFLMWALFPAPIILGEDMTRASAEYIATVGNDELLAVNQDAPFAGPARRVAGGDLQFPCSSNASGALYSVAALPCDANSSGQLWVYDASDLSLRLAAQPSALLSVVGCGDADGTLVSLFSEGGGGDCGGANQRWEQSSPPAQTEGVSLVNPATAKCLDEYEMTTPRVDLWTCVHGATNLVWTLQQGSGLVVNEDSGNCLAAVPTDDSCTNVWARPLSDAGVAFGFINNGDATVNVTCDSECFAAAGLTAASAPRGLSVRDLIQHADLPHLLPPFLLTAAAVPANGGGAAFKVLPL